MIFLLAMLALSSAEGLAAQDSAVEPWRTCRVRPVAPDLKAHTIHAYYVAAPESPDGRWTLFYVSTTRAGHEGEIRILEREGGATRTIARNVVVEDAHRSACQQWISKGRRVVFHDFRGGEWVVVRVDVDTLEERVLAKGRQVGFGAADGDLVPIYGPHGDPGPRRDLELLNVETGEIRVALAADAVRSAYPEWTAKTFGDRPISVFFPVLSPDGERVFFKVAAPLPSTLDRRSPEFFRRACSDRKGLVGFNLKTARLTFPAPHNWGHPAWHSDGLRILEINHVLIDAETGATNKIPDLPKLSGGPHPSVHPEGRLFVTDFTPPLTDPKTTGLWPILVGDLRGGAHAVVHTVDHRGGAQSWRRGHPHPVFSPDGKRLYFNSTEGEWSRLLVAELAD